MCRYLSVYCDAHYVEPQYIVICNGLFDRTLRECTCMYWWERSVGDTRKVRYDSHGHTIHTIILTSQYRRWESMKCKFTSTRVRNTHFYATHMQAIHTIHWQFVLALLSATEYAVTGYNMLHSLDHCMASFAELEWLERIHYLLFFFVWRRRWISCWFVSVLSIFERVIRAFYVFVYYLYINWHRKNGSWRALDKIDIPEEKS